MPNFQDSIIFLGTGTSVGIPVIGCNCSVCLSPDFRNKRTRSSIYISYKGTSLLVDSGPDLRFQALREKIMQVDAVLYTHCHLDHVTGFDELRAFCWGKSIPLPLYGTSSCLNALKTMFSWAFDQDNTHRGYVKPDPKVINGLFIVGLLSITPLPVSHGTVETIGYRFETPNGFCFAYMPDVKSIPRETLRLMENLDLLIIDTLRQSQHPTHLSLSESLAIIEKISPTSTLLTHLSHELEHAELTAKLPPHIGISYDSLKIRIP